MVVLGVMVQELLEMQHLLVLEMVVMEDMALVKFSKFKTEQVEKKVLIHVVVPVVIQVEVEVEEAVVPYLELVDKGILTVQRLTLKVLVEVEEENLMPTKMVVVEQVLERMGMMQLEEMEMVKEV